MIQTESSGFLVSNGVYLLWNYKSVLGAFATFCRYAFFNRVDIRL